MILIYMQFECLNPILGRLSTDERSHSIINCIFSVFN